METKYLAEFIALSETENFLQTSYDLYISQSSLSKHMKTLEEELGIQLFNRSTRKVRLSKDGHQFLPYAIKIKQLLDEYHTIRNQTHLEQSNTISIASTFQMTSYGVTDVLATFKQEHPNCTINVLVDTHKNLKRMLYQQKVDFIWIGESDEEISDSSFTRVPFITEPLVAVFSPKLALHTHQMLTLNDICVYDILIQDNTSVEQEIFLKFCKSRSIFPKVTSLPNSSVIDFAEKNLGIAIMLESVAEVLASPMMCILPIEQSPVIKVSLLYSKDEALSTIGREFLDFFKIGIFTHKKL